MVSMSWLALLLDLLLPMLGLECTIRLYEWEREVSRNSKTKFERTFKELHDSTPQIQNPIIIAFNLRFSLDLNQNSSLISLAVTRVFVDLTQRQPTNQPTKQPSMCSTDFLAIFFVSYHNSCSHYIFQFGP
jgi:hypothetical protein